MILNTDLTGTTQTALPSLYSPCGTGTDRTQRVFRGSPERPSPTPGDTEPGCPEKVAAITQRGDPSRWPKALGAHARLRRTPQHPCVLANVQAQTESACLAAWIKPRFPAAGAASVPVVFRPTDRLPSATEGFVGSEHRLRHDARDRQTLPWFIVFANHVAADAPTTCCCATTTWLTRRGVPTFYRGRSITLELLVPIIVVAGTVLGSVWVATYNNRKASERVAQEANRAKKAEAYRTFMEVLLKAMEAVKSGHDPHPILAETFLTFTSDVVVYGNPEVVMAFESWRESTNSPKLALQRIDTLLRAIRSDLGESNKGIPIGALLGLFIVGGRRELQRALP